MRSQFGTNIVEAQRKRVYYTETTSTIYEGMPVCYEFDATANVLGYDKGNAVPGSTTAEGNQNEGKYLRVEDPDADNIHAFAGVVAGTSEAGKLGGRWIDIFVPNGAIVPVRTDQNCTVGRTILAVHTAEQHLTGPYATAGRSVAVACETLDNSSAAAIILAKLDPNIFLYQKGDADYLLVDDQDTGNTLYANQIQIEFTSVTGNCVALGVFAKSSAGAPSAGYGLALYAQADVTGGTVATSLAGCGIWLNLTGGTIGEYVTALEIGLYEDGCTMTGNGRTSILTLSAQMADAVTNGYSWIYMAQNGAVAPDYLFETNGVGTWGDYVSSGDAPALAAGDLMIPIRVGGTTYYLVGLADSGV